MPNFNKVILMGNVVRDPELRYTPSGTAVTDVTLAVNRSFGSGEDRKKETLFIDVVAWSRSAETICRYVKRGDPLHVEGRLKLDQWESNGEKRSKIRVVLENFQFLTKAESSGYGDSAGRSYDSRPPQQSEEPRQERRDNNSVNEDEVPF